MYNTKNIGLIYKPMLISLACVLIVDMVCNFNDLNTLCQCVASWLTYGFLQEGIQKLLGEQKDILDMKLHEFELEMEQKWKSFIEKFCIKLEALEQKEVEVKHMEKKLRKQKKSLSMKVDRTKE